MAPPSRGLSGAAARGGLITFGGQITRFALQIVSTAVLARLLDPGDFGIYAMVVSIVGVAMVVGDFGLSMAAIQAEEITPRQRTNLFWTSALLGIALMLVVYFSAPLIAAFYGRPELVPVTHVVAVTFLLYSLTAQFRAEVSRRLRFGWLAASDVLSAALGVATAIAIALLGGGYWALVGQQVAAAATTLLILIVGARWLPGLPRRNSGMRALYQFGANTLGVQLFNYLSANADSVLIGRVWGPDALGLYDRAYQLFRLPIQQIGAPLTRVAVPILSRLQNDPRYEAYVLRAQLVLSYTFAGLFFVLAAVASPLIDILLGPGWDGAKPIFVILAIGGIFQGIGYVYYWVFLSRALTGIQLKWTIIGRTFMVAAMAIGVTWGAIGVAVGGTIGLAVNWALLTIFPMARSRVSRRSLVLIACRPVALLLPMTVTALVASWTVLRGQSQWLQLAALFAFIAVYGAALLLIPAVRRDARSVGDVLRRVRR